MRGSNPLTGTPSKTSQFKNDMYQNDLEAAAFRVAPELEGIRNVMQRHFNTVTMSGSGSSLLGIGRAAHHRDIATASEAARHDLIKAGLQLEGVFVVDPISKVARPEIATASAGTLSDGASASCDTVAIQDWF